MRLTKIQKALKLKNIPYEYQEDWDCGEVCFVFKDKSYYADEYTGNRGKTPIGIYTNIDNMGSYGTQNRIVEYIEKMF